MAILSKKPPVGEQRLSKVTSLMAKLAKYALQLNMLLGIREERLRKIAYGTLTIDAATPFAKTPKKSLHDCIL